MYLKRTEIGGGGLMNHKKDQFCSSTTNWCAGERNAKNYNHGHRLSCTSLSLLVLKKAKCRGIDRVWEMHNGSSIVMMNAHAICLQKSHNSYETSYSI
jgi:hypothetical protein